jgi:DNA-binding transcriptional MerR regulator
LLRINIGLKAALEDRAYTIKTVTLLTGINEHTLRAWETRYQAVTPDRSETGRRIYSQSHIDRIRTLMALCDKGHPIGSIARLNNKELGHLAAQNIVKQQNFLQRLEPDQGTLDTLISLTMNFNLPHLHAAMHQIMHQQGGIDFILRTVNPFSKALGRLCVEETISIAQEHAVSALIKAVLFELLFSLKYSEKKSARRNTTQTGIMFATMEGDYHELGILSAAAAAKIQGHNCIYIGPNTPPEALAVAANSLGCSNVVLGSVDIHPSLLRHRSDAYIKIFQSMLKNPCTLVFGTSSKPTIESLKDFEHLKIVSSLEEFLTWLPEP